MKDFVTDFVFSDDTMVSDVVVNLPGETTRKILASDDKKLAAFVQILQTPDILRAAVAPSVLGAVQEGFAKMAAVLDASWKAANNGETLEQAAAKPDFLNRFSLFFRDATKLPGRELAKFDAIVQTMANKGCAALQGVVNTVFKIDANAARNAQGGFAVEPYKDLSPEQIKAQLDGKNLNQILDDAASDSASPGQIALFKQVLSEYFTNMSRPADKRSAFAAALRYAQTFDFAGLEGKALESANKAATAKFAGAILKGTSPLLQKMMQGLPRTVLGECRRSRRHEEQARAHPAQDRPGAPHEDDRRLEREDQVHRAQEVARRGVRRRGVPVRVHLRRRGSGSPKPSSAPASSTATPTPAT